MLRSKKKKKPPAAWEFSEEGPFELRFERNCDLTPVIFFVGKSEGAEHILAGCWTPFVNAHVSKKKKKKKKKKTETSLYKKISKKKSSPCRDSSIMWPHCAYHGVHSTSCFCTLSASAFMH